MDTDTASAGRRDAFELAALEAIALFDRDVARRTVRVSAFLAAAGAFVFAALYLVGGPAEFVGPTMLAGAALVVVGLLPFRSWTVQMNVGVAIGLALLTSQVFMLGRIDTGSTVWFLVPPVAAMLVGARRVAAYSILVTIAVLAGVIVADALALPIVGHVEQPRAQLVMALSMLGALVCTVAVANVALRARRSLMADIEARTNDLAGALQEARAARVEALAAVEARDRFFANLTHEIRTPLNGIASSAELLAQADVDDDLRPLVEAMDTSTANLVALVNAMLDHARLRAGRVGVEAAPVEVRTAAATLADLFRAQAAAKGLALSVVVDDELPAWIEVDAIKLRQVVGNLVANAIKFTTTGSVTVTWSTGGPDIATATRPRLVISVADTGIGIPPEQVLRVFEPFVQGDASISRQYGGTGLGLAIARQLAELMGGTLVVCSAPGAGSMFTLSIPIRAVEAPRPAEVPPAATTTTSPAPTRVRVLLVEDNAVNRTVATHMLERLDAELSVAVDGEQAVRQAVAGAFDLVLMDLQMPRLDGIEAARRIRAREAAEGTARLRIVAMTGNDPADYGDACEDAGMDGFLMKPVGLAELREVLAGRPCRVPA